MKLARRFFFLSATLFHSDKKAATPRLFLLLSVSTVFCSLSLLTVSLFPRGTRGTLMTELEREKIPQHVSSKKSPLSKKNILSNVEKCYIQFIWRVLCFITQLQWEQDLNVIGAPLQTNN